MPEKQTVRRARKDKREGKSPSTQAGEFVREEIHHIREGKHGARSPQQAIAIGLSKARRSGVDLPPPGRGKAKEKTRKSAERAYEKGRRGDESVAPRRSRATSGTLKREPRNTASKEALGGQARSAAKRRNPESRSTAARRAAQTKGPEERSQAARKAARTRAKRSA